MKRLNLALLGAGLILLAACQKRTNNESNGPVPALSEKSSHDAALACQPGMYSLAVDSVTGNSYVYKVSGAPGAPPVTVSPYIVSGTNQLLDGSTGLPIRWATGLAFDPTTGIFYGTTGAASPTPNRIFRFVDPNLASVAVATTACGIALDLSDVERDPTTGRYYAINRSNVAPNNRVVGLGLPGAATVICLPNPLPVGLRARGLTFDCDGRLYVIHTAGTSGIVVFVDKTTGLNGATYPYPGPITTVATVANPELGLHFDCLCFKEFITASFNPVFNPLMTDGLPTGLGGPIYNAATGVIKGTVDFARP